MKRILNIKDKKVRLHVLVAIALVSLLFGAGASKALDMFSGTHNLAREASASESQTTATPRSLPDFVSLVKKLRPVVVNVSTTQVRGQAEVAPSPFGEEEPFGDFWRKFFGGPFSQGPQRQQSLGTGFIIDRDGYILTNNHVIDDATKIMVRLADEREFEAKVIGKDPKTDIAVIKINAKGDLATAPLGDSDRLQVGEWVLAMGQPFGLDNTVTAGIVSAKGRHIGAGPYDNFIQTDASINPGNSGGPLINIRGEVIGINTAIFSQSGGNIGIGFATPINIAKEILPQLKSKGKVTRGWLGVVIQNVTPDIAESLGLDKTQGGLVADVAKNGPAEHAGIKIGDVIVEFEGREIKQSSDLPALVARISPGKQVRMKVLRDKKEIPVSATIGELKEEEAVASAKEKTGLGLTVQNITPRIARSLGLERPQGVVITGVEPGSPAEDAGLQRGDVILEVDRKPIQNLSDYRKAVGSGRKEAGALFLVKRGESTMFLALKR